MGYTVENVSCTSKISPGSKLSSLETALQQSITNFHGVVKDFEELHLENEECKKSLRAHKEKCESSKCSGSELLNKIIESKNRIIQSIASTLTQLYETKDLNLISEAFKIICEEGNGVKIIPEQKDIKDVNVKLEKYDVKLSPKKELSNSMGNFSIKEESMSEIEATPGRTSPIIQLKKLRNDTVNHISDQRDKKKCPGTWNTSESKAIKLVYSTPKSKTKGGYQQSRLNIVKVKIDNVVDLTSSPELMTGNRNTQGSPCVQPLVKKESTDNDETILPSPTSGPSNFPSLLKTRMKSSPYKKPPLCLKSKQDTKIVDSGISDTSPEKGTGSILAALLKDNKESRNLLKPVRFMSALDENSPIKMAPMDEDETHCDISSSLSILERVDMMEHGIQNGGNKLSPTKRPLAENKNIVNVHPVVDTDSSISLLHREKNPSKDVEDKVKRKLPAPEESLYKEPTVRKKAEKRQLPGWSCEECRLFYDELYKDDPEMLAKKMEECSKHRGRRDPARPSTPGGFWDPRWNVPDDTEEFNRRNNAL